jgi:hypothetical protein
VHRLAAMTAVLAVLSATPAAARLTAITAVLAVLPAPPAVAAGDPILPLDQVRAGMTCTGYSVVKGTAISPFAVTIEDVVRTSPATTPRILIRASGPAVDATGLGQGFSGSPIYCPGEDGVARVVGAVSEGIGDYGNRVVLAMPIEAILGQPVDPPPATRSAPRLLRRARPLAGPLSVTGLSPDVAGALRAAARRAGRAVLVAPAAPRAAFPHVPLVPGASMAVGLAGGDVAAGAVGTVSYVDGDRVWGFAHPLDAAGRRSLLLQDAYVYTVVNGPLGTQEAGTYKLAAPGHDVGAVTADGLSAVAGRLGVLPDRFPLRIFARDLDRGGLEHVEALVADESGVGLPAGGSPLSLVGPLALAQAVSSALGATPVKTSGSMCARFQLREQRRPLRFCNTYVGGGGGGELAGLPLITDLSEAIDLVDAYDATLLHVTKVELNVKLQRGLRQAFLVSGTGPSVVRRGRTARVRLRLRRSRGQVFSRTVRVRVPRGMPPGVRELTLTGTPSDGAGAATAEEGLVEILLGPALEPPPEEGTGPTTLRELTRAVAKIARYDGVTASFRPPGAGERSDAESDPTADGEQDLPPGPEGVALRERRVYRDPGLRISGSVTIPVVVR